MQRNIFHIVSRIIRITFRSRKMECYERNWTIAKNGNARLRLSPRAVVLSRFSNEFKFRIIVPISNLFDNQKKQKNRLTSKSLYGPTLQNILDTRVTLYVIIPLKVLSRFR